MKLRSEIHLAQDRVANCEDSLHAAQKELQNLLDLQAEELSRIVAALHPEYRERLRAAARAYAEQLPDCRYQPWFWRGYSAAEILEA